MLNYDARRRWLVLALLGTAFFMTILDGTSLLAALPSIANDLRLRGQDVQWTVTAYALAFSSLLLVFGRAADRFGRRRMFLAGMALRVLASLACGLAPSITVLVAARAAQGMSAAIIAPAALPMVTLVFPAGSDRNRALAIWGSLGGFGATAGLLLGGALTQLLGWQWVFWLNVPVGIAVLAMAPLLCGESRGITARPRLVRSRTLVTGNLLLLVAGMTVDGMLVTLTTLVQHVFGWPALRFGLVAAVMTVTSVIGAMSGQPAIRRYRIGRVAVAGTGLLALACLVLALAHASVALLVFGLLVFGAGMGAAVVCAQITALTGAGERDAGVVAAFADTSFALGTAIGAAICAGVGGMAAFGVAGGFAVAGVLISVVGLGVHNSQSRAARVAPVIFLP